MKPNLILSPCGTSLLTNGCNDAERKLIGKYANAAENEVTPEDKNMLQKRINVIREKLEKSTPHEVTRLSAELHAIVRFYDFKTEHKSDLHYLVVTDTWLGQITGALVKRWLEKQGLSVYVHKQPDLQTKDLNRFQLALSDLVVWCENNIPEGYHVVFNLTGGFKSVQGFLQALAMFYADEAIYVFESQTELMRLPRLPVRIDPGAVLKEHFSLLRKLALGLSVSIPEKLPRTLLMQLNGATILSEYGQIIYQQMKADIYTERILEPPLQTIRFGPHFLKSVQKLSGDRIKIVNERIDDLSLYLESGRTKNTKRLDFKDLSGEPKPHSTHEFDAWADQDAKRIFCHFEEDTLVLDQLDKGLH